MGTILAGFKILTLLEIQELKNKIRNQKKINPPHLQLDGKTKRAPNEVCVCVGYKYQVQNHPVRSPDQKPAKINAQKLHKTDKYAQFKSFCKVSST